ncbi:hypothetical protein C8C83_0562 [Flavobacterium sp. 90]|nr:hypothetical protein C8C82_0857 [Flavobacterium sp. 81]TCK52753.1 hypothetical protein C8C83_0562 [Flavobacterium sp. 90]
MVNGFLETTNSVLISDITVGFECAAAPKKSSYLKTDTATFYILIII